MRIDFERSGEKRRWSLETHSAVDRAVAGLLVVITMLVAQLLGVPMEVARLISGLM